MAAQDSRVGDRQAASMRIKLKYPDVETFIQKYAVNISRGGIFIATKNPKPVGTFVRFEFLLSDAGTTSIIRGEGQVQWTKEYDQRNPGKPHGMGVKFARLDVESQAVIDRALKWRAEHGTSPGQPVPVPTSSAHSIVTTGVTTAATGDSERQSTRGEPRAEAAPLAPLPASDTAVEQLPTIPVLPTEPDSQPQALATATATIPVAVAVAAAQAEPVHVEPVHVEPAPGGRETRPIAIDDRDEPVAPHPMGRAPNEHTRPISLATSRRGRPGDEIDALVAEWGLSEEKLARILKRARPRIVEATAELERLLLKPPKPPKMTKAEAMAELAALLAKKNGRNGTPSHE